MFWQSLVPTLFSVFGGLVTSVVGYLLTRRLRDIFASTERTEQHAKATDEKVGQLDVISTSSWRTGIETRLDALAERRSGQLSWQAGLDGRFDDLSNDFEAIAREWPAFRRFVLELDAYAHGKAPMPTLTPETRAVSIDHEGASS